SLQRTTNLSGEIKKVLEIGLQMSTEASNLTSALKGDSQQRGAWGEAQLQRTRSEEHTSELQSRFDLVCRLLLEKKNGSGVGKSTLLGMIARNSSADVNVIAVIGERGREVREFIEKDLGDEGLRKSVVIVATSDQPALMRIKGAYTATAISEYFRSLGLNVNLMMDSVTRVAMAQREIGL